MHPIVKARHIHHLSKAALQCLLCAVHTLCDRTGGIELMAQLLQMAGYLTAFLATLFGDLIADAPHDDARVVSVDKHEVRDISVGPLVKETGIAILALRIEPHVETLGHDHHTQRVADIHLHLTRHVM